MTAVALKTNTFAAAWSDVLVDWACRYARQGYPVFPVRGDKRPLVKWKDGATTDPAQIRAWWLQWPLAMIGMPTGKPSGLIVLDVDIKNGVNGFDTLKANGWDIPREAIEVLTPSGGSHFYFRAPEGVSVRNSAGKIGPGVDLRADGGFIVLPPSIPTLDSYEYRYAPGQGEYGQGVDGGRLLW